MHITPQALKGSQDMSLREAPACQTTDPQPRKKSHNISVACTACKLRKTRCDGVRPCKACRNHSSQCDYDAASDQRRKLAIHRNQEELTRLGAELQRHRLVLGNLVAIFRSRDATIIQRTMQTLGQDISTINLITQIDTTMSPNSWLRGEFPRDGFDTSDDGVMKLPVSTPPSTSPSVARDTRHSQQFIMIAPITLSSSPWTSIATSEQVSYLVSIYFTWEHPMCQFVDKTMFLMAYNSHDISHAFCSKLLVHALLAQASLISDRSEDKLISARAFSEARLYLEMESGNASITTLQALHIMHQYECNSGRDRVARVYRYQALDTYRRLGFAHITSKPDRSTEVVWRATTHAIWGTFITDSITSFFYGFSLTLQPPLAERDQYSDASLEQDEDWSPFPMVRPPKPAHLGLVFEKHCDLACFFYHINSLNEISSRQDDNTESIRNRFAIFRSIREWQRTLHPELTVRHEEAAAHVYHLNALAHVATIILFRPIREVAGLDVPWDIGNIDQQTLHHAHLCIDAIFRCRPLYTFQHSPTIALICAAVSAFTLVAHLNEQQCTHDAFTRACQVIYEHQTQFSTSNFLLAALVLLGRQYGVTFSSDDEQFLNQPDWQLSLHTLRSVPMDLPILLDIGDNVKRRGKLPFDNVGDFLTDFSRLTMAENLAEKPEC